MPFRFYRTSVARGSEKPRSGPNMAIRRVDPSVDLTSAPDGMVWDETLATIQRRDTEMFSWSARSYAALSISAALLTMAIKFAAYLLTGSVGLLSDAAESLVNLAAALIAFWALGLAARPPDEEHAYGHSKAEYFSSGAEGALILLAAATIVYAAVPRLIHPQPIERPGLGLALAVVGAAHQRRRGLGAAHGGAAAALDQPGGRRASPLHGCVDNGGGNRRGFPRRRYRRRAARSRSSRCSSRPTSSGPACGYCVRRAWDCSIPRFPPPIRRALRARWRPTVSRG